MKVQTRVKVFLTLTLLFATYITNNLQAQAKPTTLHANAQDDRKEKMDRAEKLIKKYVKNQQALDAALAADGWQKGSIVSIEDTSPKEGAGGITSMSSLSCGTVSPKNSYKQADGTQLVVGNFAWVCSTFDSSPSPQDALALGSTDMAGNSLNVPAVRADGWVENEHGWRCDDYIYPSSFNGSSVGFELDDRNSVCGNPGNLTGRVGKRGGIYFFLNSRPINAGNHYLQMCWKHTWNARSSYITSLSVSYPFSLNVSFSSPTVESWPRCQKVTITYPNG